jgi:hypothetical protein
MVNGHSSEANHCAELIQRQPLRRIIFEAEGMLPYVVARATFRRLELNLFRNE